MTGHSTTRECVVAIHQPNFFPWLGYFDKLVRADVFVFLDTAQYPKGSGNWMNRVQVIRDGSLRWITAPVDRDYQGVRSVREMRFHPNEPWRTRVVAGLENSYRRAPHFIPVMDVVSEIVANPTDLVSEFNVGAIRAIAERLGLEHGRFVMSSDLRAAGTATERLIQITTEVGGTTYLSGGGAVGYQDDALFDEAGLGLRFQEFSPPPYDQHGADDFIGGASILDALFNIGFDHTAELLEAASR